MQARNYHNNNIHTELTSFVAGFLLLSLLMIVCEYEYISHVHLFMCGQNSIIYSFVGDEQQWHHGMSFGCTKI